MSVYETAPTRPVPLGAIGLFSVVSGAERLLHHLNGWRTRRATVAELRRLGDDQLADIGLTRADVADLAGGH